VPVRRKACDTCRAYRSFNAQVHLGAKRPQVAGRLRIDRVKARIGQVDDDTRESQATAAWRNFLASAG
jgi:hypothetical protein